MTRAAAPAARVGGLLALLAALLAAAAAWPWLDRRPVAIDPLPPAGTAAAAPVVPVPPVPPPLAAFGETLLRPLFAPTRRPPEAAPAPAQPAAKPPAFDRARIAGVVVAGATRVALIRDAAGTRTRRVGEGEVIDGWIVRAISAERVTLEWERGGATLDIPLAAQAR